MTRREAALQNGKKNLPENLQGKFFGRWKVIKYKGVSRWLCVCACGTKRVVRSSSLKLGVSQSCGCLAAEIASKLHSIHNMGGTRTHQIWRNMIDRCHNPNAQAFHRYGGRGIKVCKKWRESFTSFLDDMGEKPAGLTLERRNNNGDYSPKNCFWADRKTQAGNRSNSLILVLDGISASLHSHAKRTGISYHALYKRHFRKL